MTKEEIIKAIVVIFISALAKLVVEKAVGPYIPETKKLNSYMKKLFLFALRYVLPIYVLVDMFLHDPVDKWLIFKTGLFMSVIFFNILLDMLVFFSKQVREFRNETIKQMDAHLDVITKMIELQESSGKREGEIIETQKLTGDALRELVGVVSSKIREYDQFAREASKKQE